MSAAAPVFGSAGRRSIRQPAPRNEQEFESRPHRFGVGLHPFNAKGVESDRKNLRMKTKSRKCPVCDWPMKTGGKTVKVGGRRVALCCDDCATKIKANP